jgi:diaminopimelate decarboxylase
VYDLAGLDRHAATVRAALPSRVELLYAMKANPDAELLRSLIDHVDGVEVASAGEVRRLGAALPGVAPAAFAGPGKTDEDLDAGLAAGVHRFHVESPHELRRLDPLAQRRGVVADVLLRVNLPADGGAFPRGDGRGGQEAPALVMGGGPSPFGMDPCEARACVAMDLPGVRIRGVHAHLASGVDAVLAVANARRVVGWAVDELGAGEVNVGGGMAVDYADPRSRFDWTGYGRGLRTLLAEDPGLVLRIEPGRALTAYCGTYLTEVVDVKRSHGEWFAVVRGGTHHLRTPAAKGHSQPFDILPRPDGDRRGPRTGAGPLTLVGQLCTPKDVLARRQQGASVGVGDVVAFRMAGAYAWNISHQKFLSHDPPAFRYQTHHNPG